MTVTIDLRNFTKKHVATRTDLELATQEGGICYQALQDSMQEIRQAATKAGLDPDLVVSSGAAQILKDNFMEFVKNAYDARKDGVNPSMSVTATVNDAGKLEVKISDNGHPFPDGYQSGEYSPALRSSKPLLAAQSPANEMTGGANLGLNDTQKVCSENGGGLSIDTGRGDTQKSITLSSKIPTNPQEQVFRISDLHEARASQSHSPTRGGDVQLSLGAPGRGKRSRLQERLAAGKKETTPILPTFDANQRASAVRDSSNPQTLPASIIADAKTEAEKNEKPTDSIGPDTSIINDAQAAADAAKAAKADLLPGYSSSRPGSANPLHGGKPGQTTPVRPKTGRLPPITRRETVQDTSKEKEPSKGSNPRGHR